MPNFRIIGWTPVDDDGIDHLGRVASATALGHIKVGSGLSIDAATGVLSATGGTGTGALDLEAVDDRVAALIVAGPGITKVYDDPANTLTLSSSSGTTNVTGGSWPNVTGLATNPWDAGGVNSTTAQVNATPTQELFVPPGEYRISRSATPGLSSGVNYGVYAGLGGGQVFGTYPNEGDKFVRPFYDGQTVMFTGATVGGINTTTRYWVVNSTPSSFQVSLTKGGPPVTLTGTIEQGSQKVHLAHDLRIKRGAVLRFAKGAILRVDADVPLGGVQIDCDIRAGLYQIFQAEPGQIIWSNGNLFEVQHDKGMAFGEGAVDMWFGATPGAPASDANRKAIQAAIDAHTTAFVTGPITRITGPLYQIRGNQHLKATLPGGTEIAESFGGGPLLFSATRSRELKWGFVPVAGITTDGGNAMPIGKVPDGAIEATYLDLSTIEGVRPFVGQRQYRFECYFRIDTAPATGEVHYIVEAGGREHEADTYKTFVGLRAIDGNRFQALFYIGGQQFTMTPPTASYAAGDVGVKRHHLAIAYHGPTGKLRFFIDGVLASEQNTVLDAPWEFPHMANYLIGAAPRERYYGTPQVPAGGRVANGVIDSIHIAGDAFYTAAFTPPTGKLPYGHGGNSQVLLNFDLNEQGFTAALHRGNPLTNPRAYLFGYNSKYSFFAGRNTVTGINFDSSRCIGAMAYAHPTFRMEHCKTNCFIGLHLFDNCFSSEFMGCEFRGQHSTVIAHSDCGLLTFDNLFTRSDRPEQNNFVLALNCSAIVRGKNFESGRYQFYVYKSGLELIAGTTTDEDTPAVKGSILASIGAIIVVHGGNLETASSSANPVVTIDGPVSFVMMGGMVTRNTNATEIFRVVRPAMFATRIMGVLQRGTGGGMASPAEYKPWSSTAGAVTVVG